MLAKHLGASLAGTQRHLARCAPPQDHWTGLAQPRLTLSASAFRQLRSRADESSLSEMHLHSIVLITIISVIRQELLLGITCHVQNHV